VRWWRVCARVRWWCALGCAVEVLEGAEEGRGLVDLVEVGALLGRQEAQLGEEHAAMDELALGLSVRARAGPHREAPDVRIQAPIVLTQIFPEFIR
jgi:hypothetical protein